MNEGNSVTDMEALAAQVRGALGEEDLSAFAELLHPDVQWGPPGVRRATCRNRRDVLAWYARSAEAGMRAEVSDVTVLGDRLLVSLVVQRPDGVDERGAAASRWQILTVAEGQIVDIAGFESRDEAVTFAVRPLPTRRRR